MPITNADQAQHVVARRSSGFAYTGMENHVLHIERTMIGQLNKSLAED